MIGNRTTTATVLFTETSSYDSYDDNKDIIWPTVVGIFVALALGWMICRYKCSSKERSPHIVRCCPKSLCKNIRLCCMWVFRYIFSLMRIADFIRIFRIKSEQQSANERRASANNKARYSFNWKERKCVHLFNCLVLEHLIIVYKMHHFSFIIPRIIDHRSHNFLNNGLHHLFSIKHQHSPYQFQFKQQQPYLFQQLNQKDIHYEEIQCYLDFIMKDENHRSGHFELLMLFFINKPVKSKRMICFLVLDDNKFHTHNFFI